MEQKEYYLSGIEQMKLGDYHAAYQVFSAAIDQFPNNADFYSERGVARFHLNDLTGALRDMNKAQQLEPDKPYRYSSRAFIKDSLKDVHGAIADYKKAIELDPEDDIAYNNLGLLEEKLGFEKMAQTSFSHADRLAQTSVKQRVEADFLLSPEGEELFESFKKEMQLHVVENPKLLSKNPVPVNSRQNIWKVAFSVFRSKQAIRDYLSYIRNLLKVSN